MYDPGHDRNGGVLDHTEWKKGQATVSTVCEHEDDEIEGATSAGLGAYADGAPNSLGPTRRSCGSRRTADNSSCPREIIGPETEVLGRLCELVGGQSATRHFDHGADEVVGLHFLLSLNCLRHAVDEFGLEIEFLLEPDERDHDFG